MARTVTTGSQSLSKLRTVLSFLRINANELRRAFSSIAKANVGAGGATRTFYVHKYLAMQNSGFFDGAFNGQFKESESGEVTLSDIDHDTFAIFVDWMYLDKLRPLNEWEGRHLQFQDANLALSKVYTFADRFIVPHLKDAVLRLAVDYYNTKLPPTACIAHAFGNLLDTDPFIQLLVDSFTVNWVAGTWEESEFAALPLAFLYKVVNKYQMHTHDDYVETGLYPQDYISTNCNSSD